MKVRSSNCAVDGCAVDGLALASSMTSRYLFCESNHFSPSLQVSYALAFFGLLALLSPAAEARRLHQDSSMSAITDADILNFALNLEVSNICKL